MENSSTFYQVLDHGITCVDTGLSRPGMAACYLMQHGDELAVIETGTAHTVPRILACIDEAGFDREQVRFVFITHVHLDHAGGAGKLMQALANAKLVVHPRGARHMAAPEKLQASATAVYGEEVYQKTYGDLIPIPESRMIIADDESEFFLSGRRLQVFDTPGHAKHHYCLRDELSEGIFTGDTLGVSYRELTVGGENFVFPTTTPVQFDPPALRASIDRLMTLNPQRFYLTHYGMVEQTVRHATILKQQIDTYVDIANRNRNQDNRAEVIRNALLEHTLNELEKANSPLSRKEQQRLVRGDITLNAQGLEHWLATQDAA